MSPTEPSPETGRVLLGLARGEIARAFGRPRDHEADAPWLHEPGACFVTLMQGESLRGCIGSLLPHRALGDDVRANARAAAFHDPRFGALQAVELDGTAIEVSLLSPMVPVHHDSERSALAQLRPGVDGVVFEYGGHRSTFLPQVWEQLPEVELFMAQLKRKAGLPAGFWHASVRLQRYSVQKWKESGFALEV